MLFVCLALVEGGAEYQEENPDCIARQFLWAIGRFNGTYLLPIAAIHDQSSAFSAIVNYALPQ